LFWTFSNFKALRFFASTTSGHATPSLGDEVARYVTANVAPPTEDVAKLSIGESKALKLLVEASKVMDRLYLQHVCMAGLAVDIMLNCTSMFAVSIKGEKWFDRRVDS
jgi:hypothetical protein